MNLAIVDANLELKLAIWQAGLRQHDVAAYLGIVDSTLSDYIYGRRRMPEARAERLERCLAQSVSSPKVVEEGQRGDEAVLARDYEDRIERLNEVWVGYCEQEPLALSIDHNPDEVGPRYWHLIYQDGSIERRGMADTAHEAAEEACWAFADMVLSQIRRCR